MNIPIYDNLRKRRVDQNTSFQYIYVFFLILEMRFKNKRKFSFFSRIYRENIFRMFVISLSDGVSGRIQ